MCSPNIIFFIKKKLKNPQSSHSEFDGINDGRKEGSSIIALAKSIS